MLFLLAPHFTPRLRYAADLLLEQLLGLSYQWVERLPEEAGVVLNYSGVPQEGCINLPVSGILEEEGMDVKWNRYFLEGGEDVLGKAFWWVTEYEKQSDPRYDAHGRYAETDYPSYQAGWHRQPLLHLWSEQLWQQIQGAGYPAPRKKSFFQTQITFDLDHPWKYRHKGLLVSGGGLLKRLARRQWGELKNQLRVLSGAPDPYDTFGQIFSLCPPAHTRLFCLIDRNSPQDTRFTYRNAAQQRLIRKLAERGYGLGIHPSYTSFQDAHRIGHEVKQLAQLSGQTITHSRQHFLRYRLPDTFRHLIDAGIRHDHSLALYSDLGFRTGMAVPYPWFDLAANRSTDLSLHPTHLMDRSLQRYQACTPEEAVERFRRLLQQVQAVGGRLELLFHNDALSEADDWEGWGASIQSMIAEALQNC
jgi:hypothetical protein